MRNKFIIMFITFIVLSGNLFALGGPHANLNSSTNTSTDNGELCIYCHTPHASNKDASPAPIWNKPTTNVVFTMYGATTAGEAGVTMAGTPTDAAPSGSSMACLSCHDGVSAMNRVVNAPGSGNTDSATGVLIGALPLYPKPMVTNPYKAVGVNGDMTDDHPISIQYIEGRAGLRPTTDTVAADIIGATYVSDLLRDGKVQCSSCHEVHGTIYDMYLRSHNYGSALCVACHEK